MNNHRIQLIKKLAVTVILLAVAIVSFGPASSLLETYHSENERGLQYTLTKKSKQVLSVWGVTRGVSGLISLLQSMEIGGRVVVVEGSIKPLEWLAAADNILDKLSDICLYAVGAIIVEKLLLALSGWIALKVVVPICMILCTLSIWIGKYKNNVLKTVFCFILTGSAVCAAVPVSIGLSYMLEHKVFAGELDKTMREIELKKSGTDAMQESVEKKGFSLTIIDSVKEFFSSAKDMADSLVSDIINYIMLFAVTNIILPLLTIAGLGFLVKYLFGLFAPHASLSNSIKISNHD